MIFAGAELVRRAPQLSANVCVVGSGPAGITTALSLAAKGADVLVMEAGGTTPNGAGQSLYAAQNSGYPLKLEQARLRQLGGTSGHWTGYCSPLDPEDFEREEQSGLTGWPIGFEALRPYYENASSILDLASPFYANAVVPAGDEVAAIPLDGFEAKLWKMSNPPTRFAQKYEKPLRESPHVRVVLDATLVGLTKEGGRIVSAVFRTANGGMTVTAKVFVLAMGAIENARMLMILNQRDDLGAGRQSGLLGRCFMEHPHFHDAGLLVACGPGAERLTGRYLDEAPSDTRLFLRLVPDLRRRANLGNVVVRLKPFVGKLSSPFFPGGQKLLEQLYGAKSRVLKICLMGEQIPTVENGLRLTDRLDALGLSVIEARWSLTELDRASYLKTLQLFARAVGQAGFGVVRIDPEIEAGSAQPDPGSHHMGTTRMAHSPEHGVVDSNCSLFGIPNLFVAGSSVFPLGGSANPTLTIVALALRLADHIASTAPH